MATKVIEETTEEERVTQWRHDVLIQAGIGDVMAWRLAVKRDDLHKIVEAKVAGCSDKLLVGIFE